VQEHPSVAAPGSEEGASVNIDHGMQENEHFLHKENVVVARVPATVPMLSVSFTPTKFPATIIAAGLLGLPSLFRASAIIALILANGIPTGPAIPIAKTLRIHHNKTLSLCQFVIASEI
jgi:hypothetical protein